MTVDRLPKPTAAPTLNGPELFNAIIWDRAALDKFRRYFLPRDNSGPPTYETDERGVLGELCRLAEHEPLRFTTRPPSWVRSHPRAIGYALLGDWCAFAIAQRDRAQVALHHQADGSYKPYAAIGTIVPIGPGNDWRRIDVHWLSGRVLAYAVLLTSNAVPSYARAVGIDETAGVDAVRAHFFSGVADHGRIVRDRPPWAARGHRRAVGFLTIADRWVFPIYRRSADVAHLKRPYPFCASACLVRTVGAVHRAASPVSC